MVTTSITPQEKHKSEDNTSNITITSPTRAGFSWTRYRHSEHYQNHLKAWSELHKPWQPPVFFTYYRVKGPSNPKNVGDTVTVELDLFLASMQDDEEFLFSRAPLKCCIEIISKRKVTLAPNKTGYSIEAIITKFISREFRLEQFESETMGNFSILFPKDGDYQKFHMFYDPKGSFDGYRGIIDYWFKDNAPYYQYNPPKHQFNHLTIPGKTESSPPYKVNYRVEGLADYLTDCKPYSTLSHSNLTLSIFRDSYSSSGKLVNKNTATFLLQLTPLSYTEYRPSSPSFAQPIQEDSEQTTIWPMVSTNSAKDSFLDGIPFCLTARIVRISQYIANEGSLSDKKHATSENPLAEKCITPGNFPAERYITPGNFPDERRLFASGNVVKIVGQRFNSTCFYLNHISGPELPQIGIFPYYSFLHLHQSS